MKIAIVTPQAVPLVLGGAENLWWGLQEHFNTQTEHDCDILSVLSPEGSFEDLIASYETFSKLDLSAYDCVISGKYPAWMVNHPNHICYMLHRLRGLYDTYQPGPNDEALLHHPKLQSLINWMALGPDPDNPDQIEELFVRLKALMASDLPDHALAFPGPLSRAVIHFLDAVALSAHRIKRYAAISGTVARRAEYFPTGVKVDILYPPPHRADYFQEKSDYFFTTSRLDGPKRIDLLIEAMEHVSEDIELLIAGTGPQEEALKNLAKEDKRIRFLGYVEDDDMVALYANARAIAFVPEDEDYGLVTIEAMKSAKAVVTVSDSGGPTELVEDGETGYICAPTPPSVAKALSQLASNKEKAREMGQKAFDHAQTITWDYVAKGLLARPEARSSIKQAKKKKLTVATLFKVYPPMNGGQSRIYHLYKAFAQDFDIDIISLGEVDDKYSETEIAPGVLEIVVPKTNRQAEKEYQIYQMVGNIPINDITANALLSLTPAYAETLAASAINSHAVIASHPYMIDIIEQTNSDIPIWYEAHNVEYTLKADILAGIDQAAPLLEEVRQAEKKCWIKAERVFACAQRDLEAFKTLYGASCAHLHEVPNGVALDTIVFTDLAKRKRLQKKAGLSDKQIALFLGSWHGPNLEAVEHILNLAPLCPQTHFYIAGSVCRPFSDRTIPDNVELLDMVSMEVRNLLFSIADVALNPMYSGSGTNLKMLDYMASGIPVLSTEFGMRGLALVPDKHLKCANSEEDFQGVLGDLARMAPDRLEEMVLAAREVVQTQYSWDIIAKKFAKDLAATHFQWL